MCLICTTGVRLLWPQPAWQDAPRTVCGGWCRDLVAESATFTRCQIQRGQPYHRPGSGKFNSTVTGKIDWSRWIHHDGCWNRWIQCDSILDWNRCTTLVGTIIPLRCTSFIFTVLYLENVWCRRRKCIFDFMKCSMCSVISFAAVDLYLQ
jgi:hypothetical protein